tara:strand:- start:45 stop:428 length:384 start_codon:yes stop_codon:yes gene_type:complete
MTTITCKKEIKEAAMNHWIEYNRNVAKGIYKGDEWLDEEEEEEDADGTLRGHSYTDESGNTKWKVDFKKVKGMWIEEEEEYQWWGHSYTDESGNTISFFNATEKWVEENAEYKYNEYGRLDYFKDRR